MENLRLNPRIAEVVCSLSGQTADADDFRRPVGLCKCCPPPGRPLEVRYALDRIDYQPEQAVTHTAKGLWAHEDLLPVQGVPGGYAEDVGLTPTTRCARLDAATGAELWVKNEGVNPTGSFKDRGLAMPDAILYPTGGGTGLVGIWKALRELSELGWVDPARDALPRLFAVQSEQCAPVVQSFDRGLDQVEPVQSQGTIAHGLDVPGAIMGHGILRALRESKGGAVAVSENDIREAFGTLGRHGVAVGYESAATLAGLLALRQSGTIEEGAKVLLLLTASHLVALG